MKTTHTVKTKANARAEAITTNLSVDWEGMSQEDIIALAQQTLIIKVQSNWRAGTIPTGEVEVKATDFKVGARQPKKPADILGLVQKMSAEERAALLAQLST